MVLDALRNLLRRHRRRWDMEFVEGGERALERLEQQSYDMIVSDLRMPRLHGVALLKLVRQHYPQTVRIILTGHTEPEAELEAVHVAHQLLSKPCRPHEMLHTIERCLALHQILQNPKLRALAGGMAQLPSLPDTYHTLLKTISAPEASPQRVARVLERDIAMSAKVLQLVNSSFFRLQRRIVKIEEAIIYLGFHTLKTLVLSLGIFHALSPQDPQAHFLEVLQTRALACAGLAQVIHPERSTREQALIAGMLCDIGWLLLASEHPKHITGTFHIAETRKLSLEKSEEEYSGFTHAQVGAYLLGLWNLPYPVVEAVAHHHTPQQVSPTRFDLLATMHISSALIEELPDARCNNGPMHKGLVMPYVEALGIAPRLDAWRQSAQEHWTMAQELRTQIT